MNIQEEEWCAIKVIDEARKLNNQIGRYYKRLSEPFAHEYKAELTNGTIRIGSAALREYYRFGGKMSKSYIEETELSFVLAPDRTLKKVIKS